MNLFYPFFLIFNLTLFSLTHAMAQVLDPGQAYFKKGHFEKAAQYWHETLLNIPPESSPEYYIDTSMRLANAYRHLGHLQNALEVLHCAQSRAYQIKDGDTHRYAKVLSQLGSIHLVMGKKQKNDCKDNDTNFVVRICQQNIVKIPRIKQLNDKSNIEKAEYYLEEANKLASNNLLNANIFNKLGNLYVEKKDFQGALPAFRKSIQLAEKEGDNALKLKVLLNIAQTQMQNDNDEEAKIELEKALQQIKWLPKSHEKAFALMSIVYMAKKLSISLSESNNEILQDAFDIAKTLGNKRAMAYAKYYLAQFYAEKQDYGEAIGLTQQAISYAQNYPEKFQIELQKELWGYPELLFKLKWQLGKFLRKQNSIKHKKAIDDAYVEAGNHLSNARLRYDSFSPTLFTDAKEFYFDWADLLLQEADKTLNEDKQQELLKKAIKVVELFEVAEVHEYYRDECVTKELEKQVEHLDVHLPDKVAIFYPLLFQDRIVSLMVTKDGITQDVYPHKIENSKGDIDDFWYVLNNRNNDGSGYKDTIYDWFRTSFEKLEGKGISTIIIVPHGPLYKLPFSALYDNTKKQYLIEKYALITTPSITLTESKKRLLQDNRLLLGGLSIFPEKVELSKLCFVATEIMNVACIFQGKHKELKALSSSKCLQDRIKNCNENGQVNAYSELRQCLWEEGIDCTSNIDVLLEKEFTIKRLENLLENKKYSNIHISTHGRFQDAPEKNILYTSDGDNITLSKLSQIITKDSLYPLDLLTLSACESVRGDDDERAALGFASTAIRSGASSVLGTLWLIDDEKVVTLMKDFYEYQSGNKQLMAKAAALQRAICNVLKNEDTKNPYYWASFVLIGKRL